MSKTGAVIIILSFLTFPVICRGISAAELPQDKPRVLSLDECVKSALANNQKLVQALSTVNLNRAKSGEALSGYLPKIDTTLGFTHTEASKVSLASLSSISKKSNTSSEETRFKQLLWDFGRTLDEIKSAKENLSASEYSFLEIQQDVILKAKTGYFDVLRSQLLLDVAKENLEQEELHLAQAKGYFEVGLRQKFDVTKAQAQALRAKLDYTTAKKNLELAKAALNNVIGKSADTNYIVEGIKDINPQGVNTVEALSIAMKNRADILKLNAQVRVAERDLSVKKKGNWPEVSLSAGQQASDSDVKGIGKINSWDAGLNLKWPWFDGFKTSSQVRQSRENLNIARSKAQEVTLDISLEVWKAVFGLDEAAEKLHLTEKLLQESQEYLEIAEARYAEGLISLVEREDARVSIVSARNNHAVSISDYLTALAAYDKSIGN